MRKHKLCWKIIFWNFNWDSIPSWKWLRPNIVLCFTAQSQFFLSMVKNLLHSKLLTLESVYFRVFTIVLHKSSLKIVLKKIFPEFSCSMSFKYFEIIFHPARWWWWWLRERQVMFALHIIYFQRLFIHIRTWARRKEAISLTLSRIDLFR